MKCDIVVCDHIWFSCCGKYSRCVQVDFTNLQYGNDIEGFKPLGDMIWGYPGQIIGSNGDLRSRLYVEEKVFKNKAEAFNDRIEFIHSPKPNFSKFLDDIFGDG